MAKLFVGGLAWATNNDSLRKAFEKYNVTEASVITDRDTGRSRGFGFVTIDEENAQRAIEEWDNKELDGRVIRVQVAAAREEGSRGGFNRGGEGRDGGFGRSEGGYSRGGDRRDGGYSRGGRSEGGYSRY